LRQVLRANFEEVMLLPPSLDEWIGPKHPARFIREFVEQIDLAAEGFEIPNWEEGGVCFAPELLLSVWLYGYLRRIRSLRGLEQACASDLAFMYLSGMHRPDHNALWRFWKANKKALKAIFKKTVRVAVKLELVELVLQAIDGTKIMASCSKHGSFDAAHLRRLEHQLEESINRLEHQIEQAGPELSLAPAALHEDLADRRRLQSQVKAALQNLEASASRYIHPKELDARRMKTEGSKRFGYNAQISVDAKAQIVTAAEVTSQQNDSQQLLPMIEAAQANTQAPSQCTLADSGYSSGAQLAAVQEHGHQVIAPLAHPIQNTQQNPYHSSAFGYDREADVVICPQGQKLLFNHSRDRRGQLIRVFRNAAACAHCSVRSLCTTDRRGRAIDVGPFDQAIAIQRQKMAKVENQQLFKERARIVEPVFAAIKALWQFQRWTVRGLENVCSQWTLLCTTWNLKKLYQRWAADIA
jgi:transposase